MKKHLITAAFASAIALPFAWADDAAKSQGKSASVPEVPEPSAESAEVPKGYKVEVFLKGLNYPTSVELDDQGNVYVAEAGYSYGDPTAVPRILKVTGGGETSKTTVVVSGEPLVGPINDLLWHKGRLYISHRGKISVLEGNSVRDLVTDLPSLGDHHNNQLTAGPDGKIYFGQGVATNSGVVGKDNFEMGWLKKHPDFHDVPARDVVLANGPFESENPLGGGDAKAKTSAFQPFGKAVEPGTKIPGQVKAGGTILRMNPDGTGLEVYASGFRNPYGLMWSPDGKLYATENGFDVRGSRPIANDLEDLYLVKEGAWYGWPDFAGGEPVTAAKFKPANGPAPEFLLKEHPPVEKPVRSFPKHSAITKLDFSPGGKFGFEGQMFVAFFGHMAPMTGTVDKHGGHRVVRIDLESGEAHDFLGKKGHGHGEGSGEHKEGANPSGTQHGKETAQAESHGSKGGGEKSESHAGKESGKGGSHGGKDESVSAGPRRLADVRFAPNGEALYVVDFGTMVIAEKPLPVPMTGLVWRILPAGDSAAATAKSNRGEGE